MIQIGVTSPTSSGRMHAHAAAAVPVSNPPVLSALPRLVWQKIIHSLDSVSQQHLMLTSVHFWRLVVASATPVLTLPACHLKEAERRVFAEEVPAASCLHITAPRRPVTLSCLNQRQRCEQMVSIFLDNMAPWPSLKALDVSTAISYLSCSTLQLMVECFPQLRHLALPPVHTRCGDVAGVLHALQQLPELCSCDLDCRQYHTPLACELQHKQESQHKQECLLLSHGHKQQQQGQQSSTAVAEVSTSPCNISKVPLQFYQTIPEPQVGSDTAPAADAAASTVCPSPSPAWSEVARLSHLQHLQLRNVQPACLPAVVSSMLPLHQLCNLSLMGLCKETASLLLAPHLGTDCAGTVPAAALSMAAAASQAKLCACKGQDWLLGHLRDLARLTRLELGVEESTARCAQHDAINSSSHRAAATSHLLIPGRVLGPVHTSAVLEISCPWSDLHALQELVLHGICLDSPTLSATLQCQQLTALCVGALSLQHDVRSLTGLSSAADPAWQQLTVLHVEHFFDMGPNSAAVLMPQLLALKVVHAGSHSPNLACLKHHQHLACLDIAAAADSSWVVHSLQLGPLAHLTALRELRLAASPSQQVCTAAAERASGSSNDWCHTKGASGEKASCGKCSSHWLPSCATHLGQVRLLELSGHVTDHALAQLPEQFPGVEELAIDSSYFVSDGGLQKLKCTPQLQVLVLKNCKHITDYGLELLLMSGGIQTVAVQGCIGINERACQRIRKACRFSGSKLLWFGPHARPRQQALAGSRTDSKPHRKVCSHLGPSHSDTTKLITFCESNAAAGSLFLHRCWRLEQDQQHAPDRNTQPLAVADMFGRKVRLPVLLQPQQQVGSTLVPVLMPTIAA